MKKDSVPNQEIIGVDLGDRFSHFCVLDPGGRVIEEGRLKTTATSFRRRFGKRTSTRVILETGTHSPWVEELLVSCGLEVLVADARRIQLISRNQHKNDRRDAELLARLGRMDTKLLHPVKHRGAQTRRDLAVIRSRAALVEARTKLVNHVRGTSKSLGHRLPSCSAKSFHRQLESLPDDLQEVLAPVMKAIAGLTEKIKAFEERVDQLCKVKYPQTNILRQVNGVGPLTSLCFVLTLESLDRFERSRQVGAYLGLVPRRSQSGGRDPELHITKTGDRLLRTLLVQCAQYILGPFGMDSDLRRFGLRLAAKGDKNARKRAVVAVARKLAVLLGSLWRSGEVYDPLRNSPGKSSAAIPSA